MGDMVHFSLRIDTARRLAIHLRSTPYREIADLIETEVAAYDRMQERIEAELAASEERERDRQRLVEALMKADTRYVQPHRVAHLRDDCEAHVYSGNRSDFMGHQCGNRGNWVRPGFDEWGDILLCNRHRKTTDRITRSIERGWGSGPTRPAGHRLTPSAWLARKQGS